MKVWILTINDFSNDECNTYAAKTKKTIVKIAGLTLKYQDDKSIFKEFKESDHVRFSNEHGDIIEYNLDKVFVHN